jgi:hypothetical protein
MAGVVEMLRRPGVQRVAAVLAALAAAGLLVAAAASANTRQVGRAFGQSYVYTWVGDLIPGTNYHPNPPLVRPATLYETDDGSWVIEKLHWSSWGSSVARATGISSARASVATAPRVNHPATLTLSNPVALLGHEVYGCYQLTVPSDPKQNQHECLTLGPNGTTWGYGPTSQPKTTPTKPTSGTYARFYTPSRNIACEMSDNGTAQAGIGCIMQKPPALASLKVRGVATICQHQALKCTGNLGDDPSLATPRELAYGSSVTVGRFRCTSASTGVTCVVIATGKGFFISRQSVRTVG